MFTTNLQERGGRWIARVTWTQGGQRQERSRTLGPAHASRGRRPAGALIRSEAAALAQDFEAEVRREQRMEPEQRQARSSVTFEDVALAWLDDAGRSAGRPWKPSTTRNYRSILGQAEGGGRGHVLPVLGGLLLDEVTPARARAWWDGLGLSARNANAQLTAVRAIFAWAAKDGRWGELTDPTAAIRKRREAEVSGQAPRFFEPAEVAAIIAAAEADAQEDKANRRGHDPLAEQDGAIFRVMADTGLRRGEVLALRVGSVDLPARTVVVTAALSAGQVAAPKSRRARYVPLTDAAADALRPYVQGKDQYALVFGTRGGSPLNGDALSRRFLRARDRAGLADSGLTLHDLRHTTASLLVRGGYGLVEVQALLGHAKATTTERYAHHRPRGGDAERMTAALAGQPVPTLRAA